MLRLEAMVAGGNGKGEERGEDARLADLAIADHFDGRDGAGLGVQAVGCHQLHARGFRGGDHRLAFGSRRGERLLDQRMDARLGGADRIVGVQGIGECDVDGIDMAALQHLVILFVRIDVLDAVEPGERLGIGAVAGDDGRHLGISRLRDRGHEGDLGNPPRSDDGVTHFLHLQVLP